MNNEKIMHAVFFRNAGLVKAINLKGQNTVSINWYTTKCFPEIFKVVDVKRPMFHYDKASSHSERIAVKFLEQKKYESDITSALFS